MCNVKTDCTLIEKLNFLQLLKSLRLNYFAGLLCLFVHTSCGNTSTRDLLDANFSAANPVVVSPRTSNVQINATLKLTSSGGTAPFKYAISNGVGTIDSSTGIFTAPASTGTAVISTTDAKGGRDFAIITVQKDPVVIYYDNFQTGSYDSSKWNVSGAPTVTANVLRMNQNDHLRYGTLLGVGEAVTIEIDMDNINGAAGGTFCTPNVIIKNPTSSLFGYNGSTEFVYGLVDETGTFRIPSTVSGNFSSFAELRNGRIKIRVEWNSNQLRISKSDYEQIGAPIGLVRSAYWPGPVFPGNAASYANGFKFELYNNVACQNGGRIYSISIFKP